MMKKFIFPGVVVLLTALLIASMVSQHIISYENMKYIFCAIRGDSLLLDRQLVRVGKLRRGEEFVTQSTIKNNSSSNIVITGSQKSCGLTVVDPSFPVVLVPKATQVVKIRVKIPLDAIHFSESIYFFNDSPDVGILQVEITADILDN